jgi:hypothetical protein
MEFMQSKLKTVSLDDDGCRREEIETGSGVYVGSFGGI